MIEYQVKYSSRKTLNITVERDRTVIVHAPESLSEERIRQIVLSKSEWIDKKLSDSKKYDLEISKKEFVNGESLLFLGKLYNLTISADAFDGIIFEDDFKISMNNQTQANDLFKAWYKNQALIILEKLAESYSERLGVKYKQLKISDMKYR